jgi:hypothetical protein
MRLILSSLLLLFATSSFAQEASIRILTQESWPPGKRVPVTIEIERGNANGFARFFHDLPQGFTIENVISGGADFFRDNNQINYVWLELPDEELIIIQYLAMADKLLAGSFKIGGHFDYIIDGKERVSIEAGSISIKLDRSAIVESVELPEGYIVSTQEEEVEDVVGIDKQKEEVTEEIKEEKETEIDNPIIRFRVQVSISSQRFSLEELEDRVGSKLQHGIIVLKSGNMFKYHSGSFPYYESASEYLAELKAGGISDAFVVAFSDENQISISEAREATEK